MEKSVYSFIWIFLKHANGQFTLVVFFKKNKHLLVWVIPTDEYIWMMRLSDAFACNSELGDTDILKLPLSSGKGLSLQSSHYWKFANEG